MTEISRTSLSQFQYGTPTVGDEKVSEAAVKKLEQDLNVKFTDAQVGILKDLFMQGKDLGQALDDPNWDSVRESKMESLSSLSGQDVAGDIYAFMALFQKIAQTMRSTAQVQRTSELQQQLSEMEHGVDEMKKAAELRMWAGITTGISSIVSGGLQVGMSISSTINSTKGMDSKIRGEDFREMSNKMEGEARQTMFEQGSQSIREGTDLIERGRREGDIGKGGGGIIEGGGKIISTILEAEASKHDQEKAHSDIRAKEHEMAREKAQETMQQMMDVIRDIRDKLQSIQQASIETNRGIARNI